MRILALMALSALALDQISKYLVIHVLGVSSNRSVDVFAPYLRFVYGENRGINFGIGGGIGPWMLITLACVICLVVLIWILRSRQPAIARASAGLLIGGALGNVVDRVLYGFVLDFLNNSCCGLQNPFVYNVADIFIFAGAIGLIFFADDGKQGRKKGT